MTAISKTEQSQDSRRLTQDLDHRYGKIGISAVAAALCSRGERPSENDNHRFDYAERD